MKKILLMAVFIVTALGLGYVESAQTPNLPMLPASREGMFTRISQMTDQWLELDGFSGKKVLRLTDGKQMDNVILPAPSNSYIQNSISIETKGPSGNFPYVQAENGKRYLPNSNLECNKTDKKKFYGSGCGVSEVYPDGYYFVKETPSYSDYHIFRFYKVGIKDELWHMACYGNASVYRVGRWYIYSNLYNNDTYSFYEVDTGKNVLNTHFMHNNAMGGFRLVGDYLFMYGRVFNTRTWDLVFDYGDIHLWGAKIYGDTLSFLIKTDMGTTDGKAKFVYIEWNLSTNKLIKEVETDIPIIDDKKNFTSVNGSFNGFVYYQNVVSHSFEILDVNTKQVVFSHAYTSFDYLSGGAQANNGRHIVFMDKSDIFCYDTQTGKLWTQKNAFMLTKGSGDGVWIITDSGLKDGKYWAEFKNLKHPDRIIMVPDVQGSIVTENDCVLELVCSIDKNSKIIRHELDGTVNTINCPPIKWFFLCNDKWHFFTILDGEVSVLTTGKTAMKEVYVQEIKNDAPSVKYNNDELMFTSSKTRIDIINLKSGDKHFFDIEENINWPEFAGKRYVIFRKAGNANFFILDRKTNRIDFHEKVTFLGCENETLYFSGEKDFLKFSNGKFETIKKRSAIKCDDIQDGLLISRYELFNTKGELVQKINIEDDFDYRNLVSVEISTNLMKLGFGFDEMITPNSIRFETCPTFSLNRGDGYLVLENLSKEKISGKIWIADLLSKGNVIEFDGVDFVCNGGEKLEFVKTVASGVFVVYVESNAMMDTSKSALENVNQDYEMPLYEGNLLYSEMQKSVVVTKWGQ